MIISEFMNENYFYFVQIMFPSFDTVHYIIYVDFFALYSYVQPKNKKIKIYTHNNQPMHSMSL